MELSRNELQNIVGGGIGQWIVIGGILTFLIGVIDGFMRPLKCN